MTGFIVTGGVNFEKYLIPCLESIKANAQDPYKLIVYANGCTEEELQLLEPYQGDIDDLIHIAPEDQKEFGGLTGTWNHGVDLAKSLGCTKVIICNDDIEFDSTLPYFVNTISEPLVAYGPVSNNAGSGAKWGQQASMPSFGVLTTKQINGFCMGFLIETLEANMCAGTCYFNPLLPFGGNEREWCDRFAKIPGSTCKVIKGAFVKHHANGSYLKLKGWSNLKANPKVWGTK